MGGSGRDHTKISPSVPTGKGSEKEGIGRRGGRFNGCKWGLLRGDETLSAGSKCDTGRVGSRTVRECVCAC